MFKKIISYNYTLFWMGVSLIHTLAIYNDNDNDNELFIQTKSNEKHHKGNINNTYKNINIATFVPWLNLFIR